ncbi:hypothetical protein BGZ96_010084 [Linnemannia gamsii]|uniref:Uncharacterized protein n=1 Tax=Linnemannia gamsii TaxID=64522 RepID=A0ABQ7KCW6_9FUNG|nr:hypothetical protein BGZ96_010084 [Linnemannia gamsii]
MIHKDKVYLTMPQNNTNATAGCDMDVGFRVQYSDLAMLQWVQLQVLNTDEDIVVDNLDNSTRTEWDDVRLKNITWSIPTDLTPGDYILRAFGDAVYYCTENGIRTLCPLPLEDRVTIHVAAPLQSGNDPASSPLECPANLTPISKPKTSSASSLLSPSSSSSSSSSSFEFTSASPILQFNIDPEVLKLLQSDDHLAKEQDQEQKVTPGHIGEGLSVEIGKGLSQKSDPAKDISGMNGKDGMKKDGSESAINGAGGAGQWTVVDRVGSRTSLAVLLAVAFVLV